MIVYNLLLSVGVQEELKSTEEKLKMKLKDSDEKRNEVEMRLHATVPVLLEG